MGSCAPAEETSAAAGSRNAADTRGGASDLFVASVLILFLELACIRWFPAHILYLTFFTNMVLLASFVGMSAGCLAAGRAASHIRWTPVALVAAVAAARGVELLRPQLARVVAVGRQFSPQFVFFGTESYVPDLAPFAIPIEALGGLFFVAIAAVFIGPGQELGRAFDRQPNRLLAYTINIGGSLAGIALFSACSVLELGPAFWFGPIAMGTAWLLYRSGAPARELTGVPRYALLVGTVVLGSVPVEKMYGNPPGDEQRWSPYYRIDYLAQKRMIYVNLIGHQTMTSQREPQAYAYALPHLLWRDAGGAPIEDVLVIGAGSGNDVASALAWGARHVDAVEIDPAIQRIGARDHPDRPYDDPRVTVHLDDGRSFLRRTDRRYDLIIYALVDSLVLHSSYSNIRLESYLFTREAMADVARRLKPGGMFATYNFYRRGWIVARLERSLREAFGGAPIVITVPYTPTVTEDTSGGFTVLLAGDVAKIRARFEKHDTYFMTPAMPLLPGAPDGFTYRPPPGSPPGVSVAPARVETPADLGVATDDWPFLYLRRPMIPDLSARAALTMGALAAALLWAFAPRDATGRRRLGIDGPMFFLGAGFMLVETKAVVHMALVFGSTWMVNSLVFGAVLVMILAANLFVSVVRPERLAPLYAGLVATLAVNAAIPLDVFLGLGPGLRVAGASLLVFAPIFFAGMIFATLFGRSAEPDRDFGSNVAGAVAGGLAEYGSMMLGFQKLVLVAIAAYLISAALLGRRRTGPPCPAPRS